MPTKQASIILDNMVIDKQLVTKQAVEAISTAKVGVVFSTNPNNDFFKECIVSMKCIAHQEVPTLETDGNVIHYNPQIVVNLGIKNLIGVLIHEILHVSLNHHTIFASGMYDNDVFNMAADLAINCLILEANYSLPAWALMPGSGDFKDLKPYLSWSEYYNYLKNTPQGQGLVNKYAQDSSKSKQDLGGCGTIFIDPSSDEEGSTNIVQKITASLGRLPNNTAVNLTRSLQTISIAKKVSWKDQLQAQVSSRIANVEPYWGRASRHSLANDYFSPQPRCLSLGEIVVTIDLSGSIDDRMGGIFWAECKRIAALPEVTRLVIVTHDVDVTGVTYWEIGDDEPQMDFVGGGGTSHVPVFDWIQKNCEDVATIICLTDLWTVFPEAIPNVPVTWVCYRPPGSDQYDAPPFGNVIPITVN